jgi:MFS family permease
MVALALCMALQMTGLVMITPLFALRLESFGGGVQALGLSDSAYAFTAMVFAPFMGSLADRIGRRPVILLSLAAYAIAFVGFLFVSSTGLFIFLRGIAGAFTAGLIPSILSSVGDLAPGDRRAQWIGIVHGGASVGWVLGPVFGGWLNDAFGASIPFAVSIFTELAALLLAGFFIPETRLPGMQAPSVRAASSRIFPLPVTSVFLLLMLVAFGTMFAWAFMQPRFMFFAYNDLDWTASRLGFILSAYGFACMLGMFLLSRLSDRLGRRPVLVLGLCLFSLQFLGLAFFRQPAWIFTSFILAGLGNALLDPALSAHLLDIAPPGETARILGLRTTAGSLGSMLGPALLVLFASIASAQVIFLCAAILVCFLVLACVIGLRVQPGREASVDPSNAAVSR